MSTYLSKRPHLKSRAGCQGCKRRKIKCDEACPKCTFCQDRNLRCIYIGTSEAKSPIRSPRTPRSSGSLSDFTSPQSDRLALSIGSPGSPQIPRSVDVVNGKNAAQLQMMHQWFASTHDSFNMQRHFRCVKAVWQVDVSRLAYEHEFLMHTICAVTSLHLQHMCPDGPHVQYKIAVYQDKAIQGFRRAVSDISESNYHAVLATSLLFLVLAMGRQDLHAEGELRISNWFGLLIGVQSLLNSLGWQNVTESPITSIFDFRGSYNPACVSPILPVDLQEMIYSIDTNDPDWPHLEALNHTMTRLGRLYGRLALVRSPAPELELEVWSWGGQVTPVFSVLLKELRPRALVIAAHYLAFLQLTKKPWWTRGTEMEIATIIQAVGDEWQHLLEVPRLAVESGDRDVVVALLLGQLGPLV